MSNPMTAPFNADSERHGVYPPSRGITLGTTNAFSASSQDTAETAAERVRVAALADGDTNGKSLQVIEVAVVVG
ncbi:hypothetical protein GCM10027258_40770 [Amycolatopsis stemonae]